MNLSRRYDSWRVALLIVLLVLLTVLVTRHFNAPQSIQTKATASSSAATSDTPTACNKFGEPCKVVQTDKYGDHMSAFITVDKPVMKSSYPFTAGYVHEPKNNKQFVVFNVTFQAVDAGFSYNALNFYMRGSGGDNITNSGNEGNLTDNPKIVYGTLQKDETVSGLLDFDAPEHGTLIFDYNSFVPVGKAIGEWQY